MKKNFIKMTNDIVIKGKFSTSKDPNDFIEKLQELCTKEEIIFSGRIDVFEFIEYEEIIDTVG